MALVGNLSEISIDELLQLFSMRATSGKLTFYRGAQESVLYLRDGRVVHAESGTLRGPAALIRAASWKDADFTLDESNDPVPATTISGDPEPLIREGLRRAAELPSEPEPISMPPPVEPPVQHPASIPPETETQLLPISTTDNLPAVIDPDAMVDTLQNIAATLRMIRNQLGSGAAEVQPDLDIATDAIGRVIARMDDMQSVTENIPDALPVELPVGSVLRPESRVEQAQLQSLLGDLEIRRTNGYIEWRSTEYRCEIVFVNGKLWSAQFRSDATHLTGVAAVERFKHEIKQGTLSIHSLDTAYMPSVAALLTTPQLRESNEAQQIDTQTDISAGGLVFRKADPRVARVQELLLDLRGEKFTGALRVTGGGQSGVILLANGRAVGVFTGTAKEINSAPLGSLMPLLNQIIQTVDSTIELYATPASPLELKPE